MSSKNHIISCLKDFQVDGLIAAAATMTKESTCKKPFMEYYVSHKDERLFLMCVYLTFLSEYAAFIFGGIEV